MSFTILRFDTSVCCIVGLCSFPMVSTVYNSGSALDNQLIHAQPKPIASLKRLAFLSVSHSKSRKKCMVLSAKWAAKRRLVVVYVVISTVFTGRSKICHRKETVSGKHFIVIRDMNFLCNFRNSAILVLFLFLSLIISCHLTLILPSVTIVLFEGNYFLFS